MIQAVPSKIPLINIPQSLANDIVFAVYTAGEIMKAKAAQNRYVTNNGEPGEFWDAMNTEICKVLSSPDCMSSIKKRGFWKLLIAYYKQNGLLFTFMREKRFSDVQAEIRKHGKMTYINMLIQHLNKDLLASVSQTALFDMHSYDEIELAERVKTLIGDFQDEGHTVGHYMLILFDCDSLYEFRRVKAVIVDPNLDIVEESDWSQYIPVKETIIVEKVSDMTSPSNNPSRGLTLKPKALDRKLRQEDQPPEKDNDPDKK